MTITIPPHILSSSLKEQWNYVRLFKSQAHLWLTSQPTFCLAYWQTRSDIVEAKVLMVDLTIRIKSEDYVEGQDSWCLATPKGAKL